MIVHSANYGSSNVTLSPSEKLNQMGFGKPRKRDISKNNLLNPKGRKNSKNILLPSHYSKIAIKASTE
ncbi:hypothetical protein G9F73_019570 [Clostridium estertheticum]|uniref:hypothetical protein n=1 Tax=Clostridium estertheticum TaxID=238834 RepID=UPI001CCB5454|nr:hypothetical protein [Clostridium estertheticum]MBZ9609928.1 hypothetical protein [Clostridium estertheticum]